MKISECVNSYAILATWHIQSGPKPKSEPTFFTTMVLLTLNMQEKTVV